MCHILHYLVPYGIVAYYLITHGFTFTGASACGRGMTNSIQNVSKVVAFLRNTSSNYFILIIIYITMSIYGHICIIYSFIHITCDSDIEWYLYST